MRRENIQNEDPKREKTQLKIERREGTRKKGIEKEDKSQDFWYGRIGFLCFAYLRVRQRQK